MPDVIMNETPANARSAKAHSQPHRAARRSARRLPPRLRPLWEAYQKGWKDVCAAMEEEDRAMLARPKGSARRSTRAEKAADRRRVKADDAFDAAKDALDAAPTRTLDDAICRIEYAIDQTDSMVDGHIIETLNAALRVLRKTNAF